MDTDDRDSALRHELRDVESELSELRDAAAKVFRRLARLAGVTPPSVSWRPIREPTFENGLGELVLTGRKAHAVLRRSPREGENPEMLVAAEAVELT